MPDHDLLQTGAVLVAHADPGIIRVTGPDRAEWLQGLLSNDIQALTPGQGCYAAWLTPQGRMITDAVVLAEPDAITLELPAPLAATLARQLAAAVFAEDVTIEDETGQWRHVGVHGPAAAETLARATAAPGTGFAADRLAAWTEFAHEPAGDARVVRRDTYGGPGFVVRTPAPSLDHWMSRLRLAGGTVVPAAVVEYGRIEAGRPEFLVDMDADTIPLEAGIEGRAISFTKGCYVGQEVIVRVLHRGGGRVARRLVGLAVDGDCVPARRATVRTEKGDVGRVTSAAWSPRLGRGVALAYVQRDAAEPGTPVTVACDGDDVRATVRELPLA